MSSFFSRLPNLILYTVRTVIARCMHVILLLAAYATLGLKVELLPKDHQVSGLGSVAVLYGNERGEQLRFPFPLQVKDDPHQGCARCDACKSMAKKYRCSAAHSCWRKGLKGGEVPRELRRRQACADLAANETVAVESTVDERSELAVVRPSPEPRKNPRILSSE